MALKPKSRGYIREWMELAGLKQADLVKRLDWSKAKANSVWHGEQRYNEDLLEEVAPLVNARPYELLMHPSDAMTLRQLQAALEGVTRPVKPPENNHHTPRRKAS